MQSRVDAWAKSQSAPTCEIFPSRLIEHAQHDSKVETYTRSQSALTGKALPYHRVSTKRYHTTRIWAMAKATERIRRHNLSLSLRQYRTTSDNKIRSHGGSCGAHLRHNPFPSSRHYQTTSHDTLAKAAERNRIVTSHQHGGDMGEDVEAEKTSRQSRRRGRAETIEAEKKSWMCMKIHRIHLQA